MQVPAALARGTIRVSLSRLTTQADVDALLEALPEIAAELTRQAVPAAG